MSDVYTMQASVREMSSKGAARQLRTEGFVPAVVYGAGKEPQNISVSLHDMQMAMQMGGFFTSPQEIKIDGKVEKVLPREVQHEPVYDKIIHADFLRFDPKREIKVMVQVVIVGADESEGVKKGGVPSLLRNEVELVCRADSIPNHLEVSIAGLDIGEAAHFSSIALPEGVRPVIDDRDFTVANILSSRTSNMAALDAEAEAEEEAHAAEEAEGVEAAAEGEAAEGEAAEGEAAEGEQAEEKAAE